MRREKRGSAQIRGISLAEYPTRPSGVNPMTHHWSHEWTESPSLPGDVTQLGTLQRPAIDPATFQQEPCHAMQISRSLFQGQDFKAPDRA